MYLSPMSANLGAAIICRQLDNGKLLLFKGKPGSDDPPLVSLSFPPKAFMEPKEGIARCGKLTGVAEHEGRANWFRAVTPSGEVVFTGTIGTSKFSDITLSDPDLNVGDTVSLDSFEFLLKSS